MIGFPAIPGWMWGLMAKEREPQLEADPGPDGAEEPLEDRGRSLGLRLLALLGAFAFLMLGISSIVPLLQPPGPAPMPDRRQAPVG
jgi:hypothetical protein